MLMWIARHDWRLLKADRTLWVVGLLFGLTLLYGVWNGAVWVSFQKSTIQSAGAEYAERLKRVRAGMEDVVAGRSKPPAFQDPRNPSSFGNRLGAPYAISPPAALAPLAVGQSDLLPYCYKITAAGRESLMGTDEIENPLHLLSGRFDLAFVILYLYPLVILALSYSLLSAEKENGTLAMTLSQPVSLRSLVTGKILVRFTFTLVVAVLLTTIAALAGGCDLSAPGAILRLLLWIATVSAYGAFWFSLGALVNAGGRGSATNALILAGSWLASVLLIPSVLNVIVKSLHPVPSRVEMIQAMRETSRELAEQRGQLLSRFLDDHPELVSADGKVQNEFAVRNAALALEMDRRMGPIHARFEDQVQKQQQLIDRYRFLSPAILAQSALYDLAGTGAARHQYFVQQVAAFQRQWRDFFQPMALRNKLLTPEDLDRLPQFRFQEEDPEMVAGRVLVALAGLLAGTLLLFAWGWQALCSYRVSG